MKISTTELAFLLLLLQIVNFILLFTFQKYQKWTGVLIAGILAIIINVLALHFVKDNESSKHVFSGMISTVIIFGIGSALIMLGTMVKMKSYIIPIIGTGIVYTALALS